VSSHLALIEYTVDQVHPDIARLTIQLVLQLPQLPSRDLVARFRTPPRGAQAQIGISVPDRGTGGPIIIRCSPSCAIGGTFINNGSPHLQAETTADTAPYFTFDGTATAYFVVKAHSFGVASNGLTAEVAFPQISLTGTRRPTAILTYQIPSASSYDWSSVPTSLVPSNSRALWTEAVTPGNQLTSQTGIPPAAPVASGINHTAQTHDSTLTLIVGIMFGIGGSAIIAAVQEARHAAD
jgi:hypothetical protein